MVGVREAKENQREILMVQNTHYFRDDEWKQLRYTLLVEIIMFLNY